MTASPAELAPSDDRVRRALFTLRESAAYLDIATSTLHQWARPRSWSGWQAPPSDPGGAGLSSFPASHGRATGSRGRRLVLVVIAAWVVCAAVMIAGVTARAAASPLGTECGTVMSIEGRGVVLKLVHESKWETDTWLQRPPSEIRARSFGQWNSEGGVFRGCHAEVKYQVFCSDLCPANQPALAALEFSETVNYNGEAQWHCELSSGVARLDRPASRCIDTDYSTNNSVIPHLTVMVTVHLQDTWCVSAFYPPPFSGTLCF
jgi:hypothetical protein